MNARDPRQWLVVAAILFVLTLGWLLLTGTIRPQDLRLQDLEQWLAGFGVYAPLVFALAFVVLAMLPLPSTTWILLAGALYGPVAGGFLSLAAATLAGVTAFSLSRHFLHPWVIPRLGDRGRRLCADVRAEGWRVVALTRLVPVFPYAPTNLVLGVTGIPVGIFALTTFVTLIPSLFAYAWLGHSARELANGPEGVVQAGLALVAVVAMSVLLPRFLRRLLRGQHRVSQG